MRHIALFGCAAALVAVLSAQAAAGTFRRVDRRHAAATTAEAINRSGDIAGDYRDGERVGHGFLRLKHGAVTTFSIAGNTDFDTAGIAAADTVAGNFSDAGGV